MPATQTSPFVTMRYKLDAALQSDNVQQKRNVLTEYNTMFLDIPLIYRQILHDRAVELRHQVQWHDA